MQYKTIIFDSKVLNNKFTFVSTKHNRLAIDAMTGHIIY